MIHKLEKVYERNRVGEKGKLISQLSGKHVLEFEKDPVKFFWKLLGKDGKKVTDLKLHLTKKIEDEPTEMKAKSIVVCSCDYYHGRSEELYSEWKKVYFCIEFPTFEMKLIPW